MTDSQLAAFQAASLSKPETVSLLVLGLFTSALLLVCLDAAGCLAGRLPPAPELAEFWRAVAARSLLLVLVSFWLVLELRRHHALALLLLLATF